MLHQWFRRRQTPCELDVGYWPAYIPARSEALQFGKPKIHYTSFPVARLAANLLRNSCGLVGNMSRLFAVSQTSPILGDAIA